MTEKAFLIWLSFDFSSETLGRSEGSKMMYLKCNRKVLLTHNPISCKIVLQKWGID